jgi:hypothetical protein
LHVEWKTGPFDFSRGNLMRKLLMSLGAMALMVTVGVHAQTPQAQPDPKQIVTVSGCVQKETDVLKRPAAATNVGMGDEFVLTHVAIRTAASPSEKEPSPAEPTGTSGALGKVYRVMGDQEESLKEHLGHRVEIVGTFKHETDARRELGAIGTSGKPPATPAEPTAANTPEITINSIKMISQSCGK